MSRRVRTALAAAIAAALLLGAVAACGSSPADVPAGTARASADGGPVAATPEAGASAGPDASGEPAESEPATGTPEPGASVEPAASDGPTQPAATPEASPGADACTGSAENRDFFAAAAETMSWDVYCAVLPDGWFVETGAYRLADGGRLDVTYRGPGGESIEVRQGAYCASDASACAPRDREIGSAAFGDRPGVLVALGGSEKDGFAVYVDAGVAPSWAISGSGMDEAPFTAIAAALHRVSE
jgi:hypothetical protein